LSVPERLRLGNDVAPGLPNQFALDPRAHPAHNVAGSNPVTTSNEIKASQAATTDGSHNIIVQAAGDGISVNVGLPHLTLIPPRKRLPLTRTEIDLLNPYLRAIPLVGREADLQSLWDWLHSARPIAIRTLTGRAGAGKTRAAIELIERVNAENAGTWWAGFVSGREMRRFAAQQNLAGWSWNHPTLIVVDYAASLIEPLRDWLRDLAQGAGRADGQPLRLLLLEREAAAGEGWLQSLCLGGHSEAGVPELFDPLEPKRLDRLDTVEKRRAVLEKMLEAGALLAKRKPPGLPEAGKNSRLDRQLENPVWEDPLYLMMAALLSLQSDLVEVLELPRTELALRLVEHEIKRLTEGVPSPAAERLLVHLAAFAALGNGLSHGQALAVAEQESRTLQLEYPGGPGALVSRVHEGLPAPDHGLAPVMPGILAEALVLRALGQCSAAQQDAAIRRAVQRLGPRVVAFVVRTVQDFAPVGRAEPLNWLEGLIKAGLADDIGLLVEIESAMPHETLVLREKAVKVDELLAERMGKLAEENPTEQILAEHSRFLNNLSVRLSALGRREEALARAEEALQIYEQLATARPDAFLPDLAKSLNNLANRLRALGRREEALAKAEEAVRILEQLATARPDAFLPDLAGSLNNLANTLSDLGRREEALARAEEALQIYEQLATARPDAFLPNLATSLNNLAAMLNNLGRREEALAKAQRAVRIREQLAQARPDAFLPDLAGSLNNLAPMLNNLGRREEALAKAEEAVRIREQLAQARPDAFLPDLAGSLNNLATTLSDLGRREEALAKAEEAVRIYEQLAKARPDAFLPDLAGSLNNLATMLSALGRREEALAKVQQAVRIYEQLAKVRPDAFLPDLAGSLNNLATMLSALGRREEALAKAEEALRIYEQLAQARPDAFLPDLAMSCGTRGMVFAGMERHEEAAASFAQGIQALTPMFQKMPGAFSDLMGQLCGSYFQAIQHSKAEPDMALLAPVLEVFEKLKQNPPKE
jgi:tetratricopeptide (TPR) repeat protein